MQKELKKYILHTIKPYIDIFTPLYDNKLKTVDFDCVHGGHLGFMQIVGVAQSCRSHNQARFILEHIYITNQQNTSLYSTFLGSENFEISIGL